MGTGEVVVGHQCRALQEHIDREIPSEEEFPIPLNNDNITFVNFRSKRK
jgi:hypothetical protein